MRKYLDVRVLGAAIMAAAVAASAQGATVTATYSGDYVNSGTETVVVTSPYFSTGQASYDVYDSMSNFQVTAFNNSTNPVPAALADQLAVGNPFFGYCVDLNHWISPGGPFTWTVAPLTTTSLPNGLLDGKGITAGQIGAIEYLFYYHPTSSASSPAEAATFQMALWDVIYNYPTTGPEAPTGPTTFSSYSGSSGDITTAAGWAATAMANPTFSVTGGGGVYTLVRTDGDQQDFGIAFFPSGSSPVVPLPAAAWAGMSLLAGLGVVRKIRGRRSKEV